MATLLGHQVRVVQEKKDLDDKIPKLGGFLENVTFSDLPLKEQQLLRQQYNVMLMYSWLLGQRIEGWQS